MQQLILHHYDPSPYSAKIRAYLGYKQLEWHSVIMPAVLPKPDLFALTGGYRRAPVLQIGADIYCDSALIMQELEQRYPERSLYTGPGSQSLALLGHWSDVDLFWRVVRYVMGLRAEVLPAALLADREAMHNTRFAPDELKAALPQLKLELSQLLSYLNEALAQSPLLLHQQPASGDFALYASLWFLQQVEAVADTRPQAHALHRWLQALAGYGQGQRQELNAGQALDIARQAGPTSVELRSQEQLDLQLPPGCQVSVMPTGYGAEAVTGTLILLTDHRVVLRREAEQVGTVQVHFPRIGYTLAAAPATGHGD
jgi:glutathione S-transferase